MGLKETRRKFCKWIYGHKQSGSNITTRGDYIITQYTPSICSLLGWNCNYQTEFSEQGTSSTNPSKNWTWPEKGTDGAHAFAVSNYYFTIDYKGYPDPIIKQSGSTYYIDYGVVDMNGVNGGHWLQNPDCTELPCPAGTTNQGTYYNHTAASAGSDMAMTTNGDIVPDSICPKGWMMPNYEGNKSYKNLINYTYGEIRNGSKIGNNMDVIALYPPLSFLRSGVYIHTTTIITNPGTTGYYWESRIASDIRATVMTLDGETNRLETQLNSFRGRGYSLRCVSRS